MKILVTGGLGVVGTYSGQAFAGDDVIRCGRGVLDVTDRALVERVVRRHEPDAVVHLAAITNVDWCEQHPLEALRVNAEGAATVAAVAWAHYARLVYVSTAGVFGRDSEERDEPYVEDDAPDPANVYGSSKLAGEWAVRAEHVEATIVRSGWMFGGGQQDTKFVGMMRSRFSRSEPVSAVTDKIGSPTYALDLLRLVRGLLDRPWAELPLVHGANSGPVASRWDVAVAVGQALGQRRRVRRVDSSAFPLPAPRARSEAMSSVRLPEELRPRDWREALTEYLSIGRS